ncbi:MAG: TIGR02594 family protein [Fulvivirga sp.]|uniref:C40 family peptidase n=1 Tax=Fulvivirga sp. TaxID=1931237 RepID=UPI0032EF572F
MNSVLQIAAAELGQQEISGTANNQRIVDYATESGIIGISNDEVPWCSTFINWVALKAGLSRTNKPNARSWLSVGQNVDSAPEPGDIVIFWREKIDSWKGHVSIFLGFSKDQLRVYCLGGNQGNQVSVSAFPTETVLGFRRLGVSSVIKLPDPVLKNGDAGSDVKLLQDALKLAGFNCGTSDGDFGNKTEAAVKQLQAASGNLKIDGEYGKKTKEHLLNLLST